MSTAAANLLKRWGISSTARVWIGGNDVAARAEIESLVASLPRSPHGTLDCAFITPKTADEASYFAQKVGSRLVSGATVWVAWPASDHVGLVEVSTQLGEAGFGEVSRVPLPPDFVTVGFRSTP